MKVHPGIRVLRRTEIVGDCLIYTGHGKGSRSGHKLVYDHDRESSIGAHRAVWELLRGPIPPGLVVRHSCDNPPCVLIGHLLIGTIADNNHDRDERGRHVVLRGSMNGNASLTEDQVAEILTLIARGVRQRDIAARFDVTQSTISLIARDKIWRHVKPFGPHGTRNRYARGCRCDECRAASAAYAQALKRRAS